MKKNLNIFSLLTLSFILLTVSFIITPAKAEVIKLNYANFPPAPTFPCVQMEHWKAEVEKRTNGKVLINTYPGGTLLGAKNMMDGVIAGQADIGNLCMAYQPGRFVVTNATSLPLGISSARMGSMILLDIFNKYQPKAFAKVKVLAVFTTAPSNIMSKKAVRNFQDIKGMDLRASGGAAQILKAWGANQIGMPMSSTPEALQKGVVQGVFSSLEVMKDLKFAEICKYVTLTNTAIYPFAVVMNLERWNSLPKDVQKIMEDLIEEQTQWTGNYMDNHVKEAISWSKKTNQVEFIQLSNQQQIQWNEKLKPMIQKWIEKADTKGLPGQKIVNDIQDLIKKHGG